MYSRITASSRPNGRDEVSSGPEVLSHKIALLLPIDAGQMDRTLALDKADNLRDSVLWWDRDHHMHMIRHEMTFLDAALLLYGQLAEHLAQVTSQLHIQRLPAALGNEHHLVFAVPLGAEGLSDGRLP